MIATTLLIVALGAFAGGFLLADRRAARQYNAILEENWRDLMKAIRDEPLPSAELGDREEAGPTLH